MQKLSIFKKFVPKLYLNLVLCHNIIQFNWLYVNKGLVNIYLYVSSEKLSNKDISKNTDLR